MVMRGCWVQVRVMLFARIFRFVTRLTRRSRVSSYWCRLDLQGFAAGLRLNNSEADIGGSFFSDFPHDLSAPLTDDRLAGVFSLGRDMQHAFKAKKQARVVRELALATRTRLQGGTLDAAGTLTTSHGWGARAAHTLRNAHSLHALAARVGMVGGGHCRWATRRHCVACGVGCYLLCCCLRGA